MPEVVQNFIDTDDFYEVREVQKNLLKYYEEDFSKHAPKEVVPRIMMVWKCIPIEVKAEENLRAGSLRAFCKKYKPEIAVRSSMSNYRER